MKIEPMPHKKLTDEQIKEMLLMIQANHDMMMGCIEKWHEVHNKYIEKLEMHFYPERFSTANVTMAELTEMYSKAYNTGETYRMERPKISNEDQKEGPSCTP